MEFRIADTFTASLAKLDGQAQQEVKTTAFDLQLNPVNPGVQFHRLNKSKDSDYLSVRLNSALPSRARSCERAVPAPVASNHKAHRPTQITAPGLRSGLPFDRGGRFRGCRA